MSSPLEGVWLPIKAELSGEAAPELVIKKTELKLRADRYEVRFDGQVADSGKLSAADGTPFPSLLLTGKKGPNAGRAIPAIYQLQGDRLRICYGLDGTPPTAFSTRAGAPQYLVFYRRKPASS